MAFVLAALVSLVCVAAAALRLWRVTSPSRVRGSHLAAWVQASREPLSALAEQIAECMVMPDAKTPPCAWEAELLSACAEREPERRSALVNEALWAFDGRLGEWAAAPRVAARVATTGGMLSATLLLRAALGSDPSTWVVGDLVAQAAAAVGLGLASAAFCVRAHREASRIAYKTARELDAAVEALVVGAHAAYADVSTRLQTHAADSLPEQGGP